MNRNPILVTGIHRSGSTFVGKMLSLNNEVAYIQEPFNKAYGLEVMDTDFKYVTADTIEPALKQALDNLLYLRAARFKIPSLVRPHDYAKNRRALMGELRQKHDAKTIGKFLKQFIFRSKAQLGFHVAKYHPKVERLLLKDPMACLSSRYLHQQYGMKVVVLVRHPLGFAGSLKRLEWDFDFDTLLQQPALMHDHLESYRPQMIKLNNDSTSIVEKAALLWNCIYSVLATYIAAHPAFIVVRHEDIARQPLQSFADLYNKLGLQFTSRVQQKIRAHTSSDNPAEAEDNKVHQLNRDSEKLIHKWKQILSADEINSIRNQTEEVSAIFYPENLFQQA